MTIAASGERKSAVDNLALRAIYKYEEKLRAAYRADMEQFKLEQAIWEAQQAAAKAEMRGARKSTATTGTTRRPTFGRWALVPKHL
jgi:hypothetical protein